MLIHDTESMKQKNENKRFKRNKTKDGNKKCFAVNH